MANPAPPDRPTKLPSLRPGITFSFGDHDFEGKPQWLIHDASRNKFFIIGLIEFELLTRWHVENIDTLIEIVNTETTLQVDYEDVDNLIKFLTNNYLIEQSGYQLYQRAKDQNLFKKDSWLHWLITYYLYFRIPLCHPDKFLERTKQIGMIVFSRTTGYIMLTLAIIALYQLSIQWDQFTHAFSSIFTWQGLVFYFIAYSICKLLHELGHAYMCKRYGVPVQSLGIAFLVFWPVLYTDTSLSWPLKSHQRLRIALAGIWIETYITIIAALLWCNIHNMTLQSICYLIITINWIASLLINVSPFMRFDGYYVLADFLHMPNLQPRSFALARWQIRRWLFDWPDPPPEKFAKKFHIFLVMYAITTWIYRLFIYIGIAVLVYHFFIKIVGILLFIIELFYFIFAPIVTEIRFWIASRDKFTLNDRTLITLVSTSFLILLFFVPISKTIQLPGTLSYAHTFLIAPEAGILATSLPPVGSKIKANQPIVNIVSDNLTYELQKSRLEYQKTLNELRRASINNQYANQKTILSSNLNKQQSSYKKLLDLQSKLTLTAPFDGIIIETEADLRPGTAVMKDEWLADVVMPNTIYGEAFVSQIDFNLLNVGFTGYFYPHDLSTPRIPIKIYSIEALNANKLHCQYASELKQKNEGVVIETPCYHVSDLGGDIATFYTETGDYVPVNSVFRVLFTTDTPIKLQHIERGTAVIKTRRVSYAYRFFYKLKTLWIQQSEF